mgnify:CR=1 FL=1
MISFLISMIVSWISHSRSKLQRGVQIVARLSKNKAIFNYSYKNDLINELDPDRFSWAVDGDAFGDLIWSNKSDGNAIFIKTNVA